MAGTKYWIWLSEKKLTRRVKLRLLEHYGSPENVYYADAEDYLHVEGVTARAAALLADKDTSGADRILGECEAMGARIITMQDADYPVRLRNIYEPPCLLYVQGRLPMIDEEVAIAMVGTRGATPYGRETAGRLAYELSRAGALIVSGCAYGIDTESHCGALRARARTVAVLGGGLDVVFPKGIGWLLQDIAATGALVSEYPPGTPALGSHFPVRNRIISGLCLATVVVEAPERSGALITAHTALEQGRDVFAVPGPINSPESRGCNRLIAEGGAALLTDSDCILREYAAQFPHKLRRGTVLVPKTLGYREREEQSRAKEAKREEKKKMPILDLRYDGAGLTDDQLLVLRRLSDGGEMQVDDLIEALEMPTRRVLTALTLLEVEGYVTQSGGKHFALCVEVTGF